MASRWFTLLLLLTPSLALNNNFDFYPQGAQKCLSQAADNASCTGADSKELNYCLCGLGNYNNDFILGSAACIGKQSPGDVDETYDTMNKACSNSQTPMKVTKKEFEDAAEKGASSSSSSSMTTTTTTDAATSSTASATATDSASTTKDTAAAATTTTSTENKDDDTGLSTGATAGVAVGAAAGGAALVGLLVWFWMQRRRKNAEESHPMLPNHENRDGSPYQPTEPKPAWSAAGSPQQAMGTPDPNAGFYKPPEPVELPPEPAPVYEMDGTGAAVEMEHTPVDPRGNRSRLSSSHSSISSGWRD
ncbi:c2h2 type zinc finger containing protein [Fusarium subglutinans]|uniref:C2h2 type zinc finger containing protein n=1 Tax=Gibberella subglutinans TaxID=42677 RepID=A0A8H5Q779_GIBSU|nr:c2h2 type zinc finger containing protein [Fusarium subglutinans]KAF5609942.1 c2h2 type zinc finger containing protein [Fusarium subglutinans]